MPEDKNHKKILELNEKYVEYQRWKLLYIHQAKHCDQQMDILKKEISELSTK